jgi:hypothetical protein
MVALFRGEPYSARVVTQSVKDMAATYKTTCRGRARRGRKPVGRMAGRSRRRRSPISERRGHHVLAVRALPNRPTGTVLDWSLYSA